MAYDQELLKALEETRRLIHEVLPGLQVQASEGQGRRRSFPVWSRRSIASTVEAKERCRAVGGLLDAITVLGGLLSKEAMPTGLSLGLKTTLTDVQRLLSGSQGGARLDINATWEMAHELNIVVLELGDTSYLCMKLEEELQIERNPHARGKWSDVFEPALLTDLYAALRDEKPVEPTPPKLNMVSSVKRRTVEMLTRLYQERSSQARHRRAREALKARQLQWVAAALSVLVAFFAWVIVAGANVSFILVALVLLSGTIGSGLSGVRRLRDELLLLDEMRAFPIAFVAQLIVGAALGLLALFLVVVGILPAFQGDKNASAPATFAVYAFVAGYSEPFVIGAIQRLAGSGTRETVRP